MAVDKSRDNLWTCGANRCARWGLSCGQSVTKVTRRRHEQGKRHSQAVDNKFRKDVEQKPRSGVSLTTDLGKTPPLLRRWACWRTGCGGTSNRLLTFRWLIVTVRVRGGQWKVSTRSGIRCDCLTKYAKG